MKYIIEVSTVNKLFSKLEWRFSSEMILILLLITAATLTYLWFKWRYSYWKRKGVPGPEPVFLFGNVKESTLLKDHFGLMCERWYK